MNKLMVTAVVALGSATLLITSASAQTYPATTGDLILGFQTASPNTGNTIDLEIDLGQASNFSSLAGGTIVNLTDGSTSAGQTGAFSIADLTSTYGTTPASLKFSVSGSMGPGGNNEVFISQNTANTIALSPSQGTLSNSINSMYLAFTNGTPGATGSTDATILTTATGAYKGIAGSTGNYGGNFSTTKTQSTYSSTGAVVFDLYDVPQGTSGNATELGYFTLYGANDTTDAGQLTFTSTAPLAAPEPSTYALFGLGALVMVLALRRRNALQS